MTRLLSIALAVLAAGALASPVAAAPPRHHESATALIAPRQDLRSPDARDAASPRDLRATARTSSLAGTPAPARRPADDDGGLGTAAIVALAAGVALLAAALAIAARVTARRRLTRPLA